MDDVPPKPTPPDIQVVMEGATKPVGAKPKRIRHFGKLPGGFHCWEWWMLKWHAILSGLLAVLIFVSNWIQTPDLAALFRQSPKYAACWAAVVGLHAVILKYRDNSGNMSTQTKS